MRINCAREEICNKRFFYKNIKTEGSLRMFLVFFSFKPKMFLTCSYFSNAKILLRGAYLREIQIVLHCFLLTSKTM